MARAGLLLVAVSIAALPACGGDDAGSPPSPAGDGATVVEISATEFALDPAAIAVEAPGTIVLRLENDGSVPHALALDGGAGTGDVDPGASADLSVDLSRGSYTVYCPVGDHRRRGMQAALGVGEGQVPSPSPEQDGESDRGGVYGY